ncbi:MAG: hypothetical protein HRT89_06075, partial [Lentisphaeria bacterium]|nr:hypothetical protein [Lentisphaeria bacterium]
YLNNQDQPAYGVRLKEAIFDASGEQKEERNFQIVDSNINLDKPLKWSGRMLPKKEYFNKFVFRNSYQLKHVDGLTYDFLYNMAKELEEKDAFLFLGAGDKSNEPLVLQRNGTAHRAFMEGRTDGESYMLILHLTNLELKSIMGDENA